MENKLELKSMKEILDKLIELDHEHKKIDLSLIIVDVQEQEDEDTPLIVNIQLKNKSQIETSYLIEVRRHGKMLEHKDRVRVVRVSCSDHKFDIVNIQDLIVN
jgi:hypothetical protein